MTVSFNEALTAYRRAAEQAKINGAPETGAGQGETLGFADVLRQSAAEAVDTMKTGESQSLVAAAGQANINDVVMAMSKAELTLQTVVTLRDRMVSAYQEIMRMPI